MSEQHGVRRPGSRAAPAARTAAGTAEADGVPDARSLTDAVTALRRSLRSSIRTEYPWEKLPMAQVELLQALGEQSPARVGDLAVRQRLAASTVSGLIGQMIAAGLVAREVDPADRRASVVTLTAVGRGQLAAWTRAHERRMRIALSALDDEDRAAIGAALPALFHLADLLAEPPGPDEQGPDAPGSVDPEALDPEALDPDAVDPDVPLPDEPGP